MPDSALSNLWILGGKKKILETLALSFWDFPNCAPLTPLAPLLPTALGKPDKDSGSYRTSL